MVGLDDPFLRRKLHSQWRHAQSSCNWLWRNCRNIRAKMAEEFWCQLEVRFSFFPGKPSVGWNLGQLMCQEQELYNYIYMFTFCNLMWRLKHREVNILSCVCSNSYVCRQLFGFRNHTNAHLLGYIEQTTYDLHAVTSFLRCGKMADTLMSIPK